MLKFSAMLKFEDADFGHTIIEFAHFIQTHGEEGLRIKSFEGDGDRIASWYSY